MNVSLNTNNMAARTAHPIIAGAGAEKVPPGAPSTAAVAERPIANASIAGLMTEVNISICLNAGVAVTRPAPTTNTKMDATITKDIAVRESTRELQLKTMPEKALISAKPAAGARARMRPMDLERGRARGQL